MSKTKTKSANPAYPDAHPTAPGGMSLAALRVELAERHHIPMKKTEGVKWLDVINMVIEQRQLREREAVTKTKKTAQQAAKSEPFTPYMDGLDVPEGTEPEEIKPRKAGKKMSKKKKSQKQAKKQAKREAKAAKKFALMAVPVSGNGASASTTDPVVDIDAAFPNPEAWPNREAERDAELRKQQLPALKALAKALKIKGFSTMRKDVLITAIIQAEEQREDAYPGDPGFYAGDAGDEQPEAETLPAPEDGDEGVFDPETLFAEMMAARAEHEAANPPLFLGMPGLADYVFDGHAGAGPSASERWMHCTMSLKASRDFLSRLTPNQQHALAGGNEAARQGTTAHAVGEAKANHMLGRTKKKDLKNTLADLASNPPEGEEYTDEMDEYVQEYVDLIKQYADERGADKILIEARVEAAIPLSNLHEGEVYVIRGSADAVALPTTDDPVLVVADLKYGEGIYVEVEDNSQAKIYALGVLSELTDEEGNLTIDIETIRLYIAQPRLGGIRTWEVSLDDLLDWRDGVLSEALTMALYPDEGATFNPAPSACQFCPARGACPALAEQAMSNAAELFTVINDAEFADGPGAFPETSTLDNARLGSLLTQISALTHLYPHLKEEAQRRLYRGEAVPGHLLVNYTPPRKWAEGAKDTIEAGEVKLTKAERAALYKDPALVTPKQALAALGEKGKAIEGLIETPSKRPVIAPEGDNRKPWTGLPPEAMFNDESTDEDRAHKTEEMFPDA